MRELLEEAVVQLLDFRRGVDAGAMNPGALDVAPDHFPHFARIEWLADVIVRAEPQRFLGRFERAESGQHDHGDVRIDFADLAQAIDAAGAGHANVADDRVRLFFAQDAEPGLDAIGGVNLIVRLQEHPQAFARAHFVIDDEDLREFGGNRHYDGGSKAKGVPLRHFNL